MAAQIGIAQNGTVVIGQARYRLLRRGGDGRCSVPATMAAFYPEVAVPRQIFQRFYAHQPGHDFRKARKAATICRKSAFIRGIPAMNSWAGMKLARW